MTQKLTQDVARNDQKWPEMTSWPMSHHLELASRISALNGGKTAKKRGLMLIWDGSGGGTRTPDTRIMIPLL